MAQELLNTYEIERYVVGCTEGKNISVEWDSSPHAVPRTNGKRMILPKLKPTDSQEYADAIRKFVSHETAHVSHTNFDTMHSWKMTPLHQAIINITEDHRIDHLNDTVYTGDKVITQRYLQRWVDGKINPRLSELKGDGKSFIPLLAWEVSNRDYNSPADDLGRGIADKLKGKDKEMFDKLQKFNKELREVRKDASSFGTERAIELAQKIIKELFPEEEQLRKKTPQEIAEEEGKGNGKQGKGKANSEGEGDGKGKKAKDYDYEKIELYPQQENNTDGYTWARTTETVTNNVFDPTKRGSSSYDVRQPLESEVRKIDFTKDKGKDYDVHSYRIGEVNNYLRKATVNDTGFANRIRTELQVMSQSQWEFGKKRGALHKGSIYKVAVPDAPHADKIFKKRIDSDTLNTAVQVVIDCSGSMSGVKYYNACSAGLLLNKALTTSLHIPTEVLGFTDISGKAVHFIFKDFSDPLISNEEMIRRMGVAGTMMSNNADGVSVLWAYNRIIKQQAKRKLMIVLSDGAPASGFAGDMSAYTKKVVKYIENSTPVEIMGVGLCDSNVKYYYKNNVVINNQSEITHKLIEIVRNNVLKVRK